MRAIWNGHITFGLISIPVALHSAVEASERVSFRLLHRKDHAPIVYKKFCSKEDMEVANDEIVHGFEVERTSTRRSRRKTSRRPRRKRRGDGRHGGPAVRRARCRQSPALRPPVLHRARRAARRPTASCAMLCSRRAASASSGSAYGRRPTLAALLPGPGDRAGEPAAVRGAAETRRASARPGIPRNRPR